MEAFVAGLAGGLLFGLFGWMFGSILEMVRRAAE